VQSCHDLFECPFDELSLTTRYDAAVAFGLNSGESPRPDTTWVQIGATELLCGTQADEQPLLATIALRRPGTVRSPFALSQSWRSLRYPVTAQEFGDFVDRGGYEDTGRRFWSASGWQWRIQSGINAPLDWVDQVVLPTSRDGFRLARSRLSLVISRNSDNSSMPPSTDDLPGRAVPEDRQAVGTSPG
jgi:hypothetical protein